MGRQPDAQKLEDIYKTVQEHPGLRPGAVADSLGLHRSEVTRALPALEDRGYLLSEDARGGLWPFKRTQ